MGLKFSTQHEWVKLEGSKAYVGISDYAQNAMGDIVYVELPNVGAAIKAGQNLGVVESVKAVSDIYSPITGVVVEVNESLNDAPELLNTQPYDNHIAVLEVENDSEYSKLMSENEYKDFCDKEAN